MHVVITSKFLPLTTAHQQVLPLTTAHQQVLPLTTAHKHVLPLTAAHQQVLAFLGAQRGLSEASHGLIQVAQHSLKAVGGGHHIQAEVHAAEEAARSCREAACRIERCGPKRRRPHYGHRTLCRGTTPEPLTFITGIAHSAGAPRQSPSRLLLSLQ
jgi:hypothetical protein